jgi:hypothetical protein
MGLVGSVGEKSSRILIGYRPNAKTGSCCLCRPRRARAPRSTWSCAVVTMGSVAPALRCPASGEGAASDD